MEILISSLRFAFIESYHGKVHLSYHSLGIKLG